ncbi:MAG: hypothetical protein AAGA27_04275 [Pseudomonadota bacterium]
MPHVELKYSSDLAINADELFACIEATINSLDASAGICKSRAYPADQYRSSHIMINVWLLRKPHRDDAFTQLLLKKIVTAIKPKLPQASFVSLQLYYRDDNYLTIDL